jgi:DNA polymerase III subunit delta
MTPEAAIQNAQAGQLLPVYLVHGEERFLRNSVLAALTAAYRKGAIAGLNEDDFTAGESDVSRVLSAARTVPMMARRRWVLVRELDRWEEKSESDKAKERKKPLDELSAYVESPNESTVLVLLANKLDARRKLFTLAKKHDFLVKCEGIPKGALPGWAKDAARRRGRVLSSAAAELIAEVQGPDLSVIDDTIERLCLFVEGDKEIDEEHVGDLIPVVRPSTVWELTDAMGRGDIGQALASLGKVYDPSDRGLRLLGVMAWSTRQLIRFQAARRAGKSPDQAAAAAGAPPFRAHALEAQTKRSGSERFERWLRHLSTIDLDLKGGSKRNARSILEAALIDLCREPEHIESAKEKPRPKQ